MSAEQQIQAVAEQSKQYFTDECQNTQSKEWLEVEGLGIALSKWAEWDGDKIMRVFRSALEDANFHAEAERVEKMREAL